MSSLFEAKLLNLSFLKTLSFGEYSVLEILLISFKMDVFLFFSPNKNEV